MPDSTQKCSIQHAPVDIAIIRHPPPLLLKFSFREPIHKLEQLERLRSEDIPRRPKITHTIDQFILNPKSILLTSSYQIPSQNKVKGEKLEKLAKNWNFRILF